MKKEKLGFKEIIYLIVFGILLFYIVNNPENLQWLKKIITPVTTAFFIAYILDRAVMFFSSKFGFQRKFSILLVIVSIIAIGVILGAIMIPKIISSAASLVETFPSINEINILNVEEYIAGIDNEYLIDIFEYLQKSFETIIQKISEITSNILESVLGQAINFTAAIFQFVINFVIAIYMLIEKDDLKRRVTRLISAYTSEEKSQWLMDIGRKSNDIFSNFVIGKLIDSFVIGALAFVIFTITKVPYAMIISLIIGITNMIPYFGPFIGGVPSVLIILFINPGKVVLAIIVILALQQFDGLFLGPLILGDKVGVNAFWIILGVTLGGAIYGVIGMFLGVPVIVLVKGIVEESVQRKLNEKDNISAES